MMAVSALCSRSLLIAATSKAIVGQAHRLPSRIKWQAERPSLKCQILNPNWEIQIFGSYAAETGGALAGLRNDAMTSGRIRSSSGVGVNLDSPFG